MADTLESQLLQADLDRIIALASPKVIRLDCAEGGDDCIAMIRDNRRGEPTHRKYTIVKTSELDTLKRELLDFHRRWKELHA